MSQNHPSTRRTLTRRAIQAAGALTLIGLAALAFGQPGDVAAKGGGGNGLASRGLVSKVDPKYPPGVQQEGQVVFTLTIAPNGTVKRVTAPTPYLELKKMGIAAIKKWRFDPISPSIGDQVVSVGIKFQLR